MGLVKRTIVFFCFLFLLYFPKGGFKIGEIPITWGYLMLSILSIVTSIQALISKRLQFTNQQAKIFLAWLPFQVYALVEIVFNGFSSFPFFVSFLISFYILPLFFLLLGGNFINNVDFSIIKSHIKLGVFFVASYGIFLFMYKITTNEFIEIPYLTINVDDIGQLEDKMIRRGDFFKLISTYNNGNIYGVCMILLLPFYDAIEKSRVKKTIVSISLFLTLSRTVWIGLLLFYIYKVLTVKVNLKLIVLLSVITPLVLGIVFYLLFSVFKFELAFLFDSELGGRLDQFNIMNDIEIISSRPFGIIGEIVYLSILHFFGSIGLLLFLGAFCSIFVFTYPFDNKLSPQKNQLKVGIFIYMILCCSDGAILLIPTMAFFWFICSVLSSSNKYFYEN